MIDSIEQGDRTIFVPAGKESIDFIPVGKEHEYIRDFQGDIWKKEDYEKMIID